MQLIDRIAYGNRLAARSGIEKAVFALGMLAAALVLPPWPGAVTVLGVMLVATLGVARVPLGAYAKLIAGPLTFLAVGVLPLLVSIEFGGPWLVSLSAAPDGLGLALAVAARSLAAVSCLLFLSLSTPVPQMLAVLRTARVPAVVTEVSLIVYRDIWTFVETVRGIRTAQASRLGYRTLRCSYRSLAMLGAHAFGRALERARATDHGLQARNWQGELRVLDDGEAVSLVGLAVVVAVQACTFAAVLAWAAAA
jgi:cobalt/nickel transport system permease protein